MEEKDVQGNLREEAERKTEMGKPGVPKVAGEVRTRKNSRLSCITLSRAGTESKRDVKRVFRALVHPLNQSTVRN